MHTHRACPPNSRDGFVALQRAKTQSLRTSISKEEIIGKSKKEKKLPIPSASVNHKSLQKNLLSKRFLQSMFGVRK